MNNVHPLYVTLQRFQDTFIHITSLKKKTLSLAIIPCLYMKKLKVKQLQWVAQYHTSAEAKNISNILIIPSMITYKIPTGQVKYGGIVTLDK